jgi:CarboxypepD_reg-like domain
MLYKSILFITISHSASSQILNGKILDNATKLPVPYAAISDLKYQKGMYADSTGMFSIPVKNNEHNIALIFSSVGYKTKVVNNLDVSKQHIIYLESDNILLDEVKVVSKVQRISTKSAGYFKKIRGPSTSDYYPNTCALLATYIQIKDQNGIFSKLKYRLGGTKISNIASYKVRLRIFSDKNQKPDKDLLATAIIIDIDCEQKYLEYNIENLAIKIPQEGFWICLETLGYTNKLGQLKLINTFELGAVRERIVPYIGMTKGKPNTSLQSIWSKNWFGFDWKYNTFMFGIDYFVY